MSGASKSFEHYVSMVERAKAIFPAGTTPVDVLAVAGFLASEAIMKVPAQDRMAEFDNFIAILTVSIDLSERLDTCH